MSTDSVRASRARFEALAAALRGDSGGERRCPNCELPCLAETWPGVWECRQCGRVENPRTEVDRNCPYCGRARLDLFWEEEIVECGRCGIVDKRDLRALVDR